MAGSFDNQSMAQPDKADNGFLSIIGGIGKGLGELAGNIAPIVTATAPIWNKQAQGYQTNQPQPTYVGPSNSQPNSNTVSQLGGIPVSYLVIGGVALVALVLLIRKD